MGMESSRIIIGEGGHRCPNLYGLSMSITKDAVSLLMSPCVGLRIVGRVE
jgi:hypothetical protein